MADYTDGLGWAKLDTTAACHLADIISTFTGKSRSGRTRMLLYCFSRMREYKTGPSFQVGYRQLAKECGVSENTARAFFSFCEKEYIFNIVESQKGKTPKRAFYWLDPNDERCVVLTTHPAPNNPHKTTHGCVKKQGVIGAHKDTEYQREESSKSDLSSPASSVFADATTEAGQMTTEVCNLRTEEIQPEYDAVEVPKAEFDAQENEFRAIIDEALSVCDNQKANHVDLQWREYRATHKPVAGDDA